MRISPFMKNKFIFQVRSIAPQIRALKRPNSNYFLKKGIILLLVLSPFICGAKPPSLTGHDAKVKTEEILKAHVSHQRLTAEIMKRALKNFIDEIDPGKTYLLENEIVAWINPSEELGFTLLNDYKQENFSQFQQIQQTLGLAIERRHVLEKLVQGKELIAGVKATEFKDLTWAKSEEELTDRLLRIRSLQKETTEKLDGEQSHQFFQKVDKRRIKREEELFPASAEERNQVTLSLFLKSVSSALDSQTAYFTPSEANQFMIQVQQRLFGIGAHLRDDLNGFTIVRLLEGSPANQLLKPGDRIIAVNHEPVVGMEITEAVELVRGQEGTHVILTVLRDEDDKTEKLDVEIVRGEIVLKESRLTTHFTPYGDGVIAVLHLFSFYQDQKSSSTADLSEAINNLKKEHTIKGIVLDLRNNSGGILPQAVSVTGLFIKKGIVASVKDNTGVIQHLRNIEENIAWDGPLVVLTNIISASAAEIVSQTLQDYGRAIVIGDAHTWGKGTFQTFTLESSRYGKVNPKGEYKVTRGLYYTVSGKSPQLNGVQSDIVVPGVFSKMEIGESYAKFPLENDQIPPNFVDTLADVPFIHRAQISRIYKHDLQPILTTYQPYLDLLKKNSEKRISMSNNYQNFLKEIDKSDPSIEPCDNYGQNDLQLEETILILKDLIFLTRDNSL